MQQLNETHELAPAKNQEIWTFVDDCLNLDVLTEFDLTYQNRHYTITKIYKSL